MNLFKKIGKQHRIPGIGLFKETLASALWWGVPLNFAMIAGTFYYTTVRHVAPWADPQLFFAALVVGAMLGFFLEYKFIIPGVWSFREKQMFSHKSEVMDKLVELEGKINYLVTQKKGEKK